MCSRWVYRAILLFGRRRCVEEPSTGFIFRVTRKVYYLSFVETYIDRK